MTHSSPQQTRAALGQLRAVADEIIVGLDERLAARAAEYEQISDRVLVLPTGLPEGNLTRLHDACAHDWVLRIDSDEVVSPALVAKLPELLATDEVRQYAIARRWLSADGAHWFNEALWWPDLQIRLVRSSTAKFSGRVHSQPEPDLPRAVVMEPLLHLTCVLESLEERQIKVLDYGMRDSDVPGGLRGALARMYEPERFADLSPDPLPLSERGAVRAFLHTASPRYTPRRLGAGPVSLGHTTASQPAVGDEIAYEILERDLRFELGTNRTVLMRVTNLGDTVIEPGFDGGRGVFVAYRWRWEGGELEGIRTPFPEKLSQGQSCVVQVGVIPPESPGPAWLDVGVVEEHIRWFRGEIRLDAVVGVPGRLPSRREVRRAPLPTRWWSPARARSPIPRVFHRVWLGDAPMPDAHAAFGETWRDLHPGWKLRLWTDADAPRPIGIERARNVSERADLVRYDIIRRYGGVYIDTDVECLRPIDDLLDGVTAFAAYEVPGRLCNAVLGATARHAAFARACQLATVTVGRGSYPEATATSFLTYVLEAHEDVTLFGPERFYPTLWDGAQNRGAEPPYAEHHWAKSRASAVASRRGG